MPRMTDEEHRFRKMVGDVRFWCEEVVEYGCEVNSFIYSCHVCSMARILDKIHKQGYISALEEIYRV